MLQQCARTSRFQTARISGSISCIARLTHSPTRNSSNSLPRTVACPRRWRSTEDRNRPLSAPLSDLQSFLVIRWSRTKVLPASLSFLRSQTERAIPIARFSAEECVKRPYLVNGSKTTASATLISDSSSNWEYYVERLGSVIQKLIIIPAATQKVSNPVPRIRHPD
jgi:hypothetical protein